MKQRAELVQRARNFLAALPSHLWLAGGTLVVAHAGLPAEMQGRDTDHVRDVAIGQLGDPMAGCKGAAQVVHGHVPVREAAWQGRVLNLDTGCVYGGALSALRWPENEIIRVDAVHTYATPRIPFQVSTVGL